MDVVVLWICFLAVLGGIALAVCVIVRDARHYLAARRAGATRLQAVAQLPTQRRMERPTAVGPRRTGRGLGQLLPLVDQEAPAARPRPVDDRSRGRGLGQLMPDGKVPVAHAPDRVPVRGLGRLVADRTA